MKIELPKKTTKKVSLANILSGIFLELKGIRKEQKRMGIIYEEYLMNQEELAQLEAVNTQLAKVNDEYKATIDEKDRINTDLRAQLDAIQANLADPVAAQDALDQARALTDEMDGLRADAVVEPPVEPAPEPAPEEPVA